MVRRIPCPHTRKNPSRRLAAGLTLAGFLLAIPASQALSRIQMAKLELARIQKIHALARTGRYTVQQVVLEIYRPIAAGAQGDYARNLAIARNFLAAAQKAEQNGNTRLAKRYYGAANLFQFLAKQDALIVAAYKKKKTGDIAQACTRILKAEAQVFQLIGKPVRRAWFTPQELEKYARESAASTAGAPGRGGAALR